MEVRPRPCRQLVRDAPGMLGSKWDLPGNTFHGSGNGNDKGSGSKNDVR